MTHDAEQSGRILTQLLRDWLTGQPGGTELWAQFKHDPERFAPRLRAILQGDRDDLPPAITTYVTGGQVEKLVNIARAEVVHIHLPESKPALTAEERQEAERRYLAEVARECRYLYTEGVDRIRAELTDVFVFLEAVASPRREERTTDVAPLPARAEEMGLLERLTGRRDHRQEGRQAGVDLPVPPPPPIPLSKALAEHEHLAILGEPGTGKSTTLQFVALCFARAAQGWVGQRLGLDEERVPLRVELRRYDGQERLDRFLVRQLEWRAYVPESLARAWLDERRLVILLDGLDEVLPTHQSDVTQAIESFAASAEGKKCRIVVTSRIAGYRQARELSGEFGHYTVRSFAGPEDALPYTTGWLKLLKGVGDKEAKSEAQALLEEMETQAGLRRVRGNPLLLRLVVAIYAESGELARNRAEVYRRYVEEVIWQRAEAREEPPCSREMIEESVEVIAWTLQVHGEQTEADLVKAVAKERVIDARHTVKYLRERLGLLAIYGYERGELVAFRHLTLQEYFVARRLKRAWAQDPRHAWRFLRPRLHHTAWQEPILLLGGMLDEKRATNLVRRILQTRSPYERELHRDLLLAAAVLGDGASVATNVAGRVADLLSQLYLDVRVKWRHRLILPTSIWLLLMVGPFRYGPAPGCLIPLGTLAWWGMWGLWRVLKDFGLPRLLGILTLPDRLSGTGAYDSLREQVKNGLARLPGPQRAQVTKPFIRALGDDNENVRAAAVEALAAIGDMAVELLTQALENDDRPVGLGRVGSGAKRALETMRDPRAVEPLIQALRDGNGDVRGTAARALGALDDPKAVDPLSRALKDESWDVRAAAARALGEIDDPKAVEPLSRALEDESWDVRWAAAKALGATSDPRAVDLFIQALRHRNADVRKEAARALGVIGDPRAVEPLCWRLGDSDGDVRDTAAKALGKIGDPHAVEPLIQALDKDEMDPYLSAAAAGALREIGALAIEPLMQALENYGKSWRARRALPTMRDPQAVEPVIQALGDKNAKVRAMAAEVLRAPRAIEPLIRALGDECHDVRAITAEALGEIGDPQAVEPLIRALEDMDAGVRVAAVRALRAIGTPQAVEPLIRALGDVDAGVRVAAVYALRAIGTPQAVKHLIRALGDVDADVRSEAAKALGEIGDPQAVEPLIQVLGDGYHDVRQAAAEALGKIDDPRAIEPLIQTLGDIWGPWVARHALKKMSALRVIEPLTQALSHKNAEVRAAAVGVIGATGDPQAVELLIRALGDVDAGVRAAAVGALGEIGDPRAVKPLIRALVDKDAGVREVAVMVLGEIGEKNEDRRTIRQVARRLWWRLTDGKVANTAWTALTQVTARLTELEVAALGAGPLPFIPVPAGTRRSPALSIILNILLAALSGLASNVIAAYLQDRYHLITDAGRFGLVAAVFMLTLAGSIWIAWRVEKRAA
ncbi:MAG: HEAT repeat domain-containing protein [Anaerolineae bacterium]|nr:HEAT repeat domain-containing protein [Anaerolineae bacterium]